MKDKKRLPILILALVFILSGLAPATAQDCDPAAYIERLQKDVGIVSGLMDSLDASDPAALAAAYIDVSAYRRAYEDMALIPDCAAVLHHLSIQWFAANQDEAALLLAIQADPENRAVYEERIRENSARLDSLSAAAAAELERVEAATSAAVPAETPAPATPDWYGVYFSEPINSNNESDHHGAGIEAALIFLIQNTQSTIDGALFELNAPDTTTALVEAIRRGVRVRLVVDDEHALNDPESTITEVINAGAEVISDERSALMHHKFFIFDGAGVWTGSTNITRNGFYNNNNNAVYIVSPELAQNFQADFEEMFTDRAFSNSEETRQPPNPDMVVNGTRIETFFSPDDRDIVGERIVQLLDGAQSSIRVMVFSFTVDDLGNAMIGRLRNGVAVEGVFETTGSLRGQMPALGCAGASVRQDGNPNILHHKVIIIDNQIVITGSFNLSNSAVRNNSENLLIIHNVDIAALYTAEWQRRFAEGDVMSSVDLNC